jgi:hypothetical protein
MLPTWPPLPAAPSKLPTVNFQGPKCSAFTPSVGRGMTKSDWLSSISRVSDVPGSSSLVRLKARSDCSG